jgi:predicted amidohydrolase
MPCCKAEAQLQPARSPSEGPGQKSSWWQTCLRTRAVDEDVCLLADGKAGMMNDGGDAMETSCCRLCRAGPSSTHSVTGCQWLPPKPGTCTQRRLLCGLLGYSTQFTERRRELEVDGTCDVTSTMALDLLGVAAVCLSHTAWQA